MAHSFVPAESATLGIVDKSAFQHVISSDRCDCATLLSNFYCPPLAVFTRVQTRESVSKVIFEIELFAFAWTSADHSCDCCYPRGVVSYHTKVQSSFMIDLNQVSLALRNSTARSLILLDEFGKGTAAAGSYISPNLNKTCLLKPTPFSSFCF